jgi:hypothetical protein
MALPFAVLAPRPSAALLASALDDDLCLAIFEMAATDTPALIQFLRAHTPARRDELAVRYTHWLRANHGVDRLVSFIASNWKLLCEPMPWEMTAAQILARD